MTSSNESKKWLRTKDRHRHEMLERQTLGRKNFLKKRQTPAQIYGDITEKRFEEMVRLIINSHRFTWLEGVSRSSLTEDLFKGIDFRIRVTKKIGKIVHEFSIPIQVKSSDTGKREFERQNLNVYIVVMYPTINIRELDLRLEEIYNEEIKKQKL